MNKQDYLLALSTAAAEMSGTFELHWGTVRDISHHKLVCKVRLKKTKEVKLTGHSHSVVWASASAKERRTSVKKMFLLYTASVL